MSPWARLFSTSTRNDAGACFHALNWTPRTTTSSSSNICPGAVSAACASAIDGTVGPVVGGLVVGGLVVESGASAMPTECQHQAPSVGRSSQVQDLQRAARTDGSAASQE